VKVVAFFQSFIHDFQEEGFRGSSTYQYQQQVRTRYQPLLWYPVPGMVPAAGTIHNYFYIWLLGLHKIIEACRFLK
jgi:hypothetical protein